jgi:hypothetical protein
MSIDDIINLCLTPNGRINPTIKPQSRIWDLVAVMVPHLPYNTSLSEKIYCLRHNIHEIQYCVFCGIRPVQYNNSLKTYRKYCTSSCAQNCSVVKAERKKTNLERYGVEHGNQTKDSCEKRKKTNLERYGVENAYQSEYIKQKIKQTNLKKYGVENPQQSHIIRQRTSHTNLKRYGTKNPNQSLIIRNKAKQTNLKKYGVENPSSCPIFQMKRKNTNLKKYGVENAIQNQDIRRRLEQNNLKKYGFAYTFQIPSVRAKIRQINITKNGFPHIAQTTSIDYQDQQISISEYAKLHNRNTTQALRIYRSLGEAALRKYVEDYDNWKADNCSSLERLFSNLTNLPFYNISPFPCGKYRPDFKLNETTYIDADGLYWHSESNHDKSYHFDKRVFYEQNNLRLYQFREDEIRSKPNIIRSMLSLDPIQKYRASKLTIKKVKYLEAKEFLNTNHIQGAVPAITYGLYKENMLLCLISIKRNFKSEWEISRFCSKLNTRIHGGFSKLLQHVMKEHDIKQIYSWCDLRYSQGKVYESNGFVQVKETLGWAWTDYVRTYPRLRFREEHGLDKIYDAGQRLYVWGIVC